MISEKNILTSLDHPFIVRLSGTFQGEFSLSVLLSTQQLADKPEVDVTPPTHLFILPLFPCRC